MLLDGLEKERSENAAVKGLPSCNARNQRGPDAYPYRLRSNVLLEGGFAEKYTKLLDRLHDARAARLDWIDDAVRIQNRRESAAFVDLGVFLRKTRLKTFGW